MEWIVNITKSKKEADEWDIQQQIKLTPEERQKIAKELKRRFYEENPSDVKSTRKYKKKSSDLKIIVVLPF